MGLLAKPAGAAPRLGSAPQNCPRPDRSCQRPGGLDPPPGRPARWAIASRTITWRSRRGNGLIRKPKAPLHVEEHDIGTKSRKLRDRRLAALHARDLVVAIEQGPQAQPDPLFVVHQQHAGSFGGHGEGSARYDHTRYGCDAGAKDGRTEPGERHGASPLSGAGRAPESGQNLASCFSPSGAVVPLRLPCHDQERAAPEPGRRRWAISLTRWLSRSAASSRSFWCRSFSERSSLMVWRSCSPCRSEVSSRFRSCSFS